MRQALYSLRVPRVLPALLLVPVKVPMLQGVVVPMPPGLLVVLMLFLDPPAQIHHHNANLHHHHRSLPMVCL